MAKENYKNLEKKLLFEKKNCWEIWDEKIRKEAFKFCEDYKKFLDSAKTEREAITAGLRLAEENGFLSIDEFKKEKAAKKDLIGKKIYAVNRDKNLLLAKIGKDFLNKGAKIIMSHIDSPHLDLKVNPLYEDEHLAFFKTHYYGGIRKYQWPTIPLSLHGVVYFENGDKVEVKIGEKEEDPIFMITDLLPHLAKEQGKKPLAEAIEAEELNLLVGSMPVDDKNIKEKIKLSILEYLHKVYGIKAEDFFSAEIQAVPQAKAKDLGFDRSFIASYGQDDRVCAFASMRAIFESKISDKTQICLLVDREEIGSEGNTGVQSKALEIFFADLLNLMESPDGFREIYKLFAMTEALSADVTAGLDPDYKYVHDLRNCAKLGFGMSLEKHTGFAGKYMTSDAGAKYISKIRSILNQNKVVWQTAGLGKVDQGGGGTIAKYLANRGMDVIDAGVPLFNMHAPLEISSKADVYSAHLGYKVFLSN